jgi:hypothetical protein
VERSFHLSRSGVHAAGLITETENPPSGGQISGLLAKDSQDVNYLIDLVRLMPQ